MRSQKNSTISEAISRSISEGLASAIPEKALTVSEWAEKYRFVPEERVANLSLAGRWSNSVTPYLVGIMDAVTEPGVNEIVFLKSSQLGGSEMLSNVIGYFIHMDPATILYVCENEGKAKGVVGGIVRPDDPRHSRSLQDIRRCKVERLVEYD